jgi:hypothetical protein
MAQPRKRIEFRQWGLSRDSLLTDPNADAVPGCDDRSPVVQLEALACAHPEWLALRDQGG